MSLEQHGVLSSVIMADGWHYEQPLSNGKTLRIDGQDPSSLVAAVMAYRVTNRISVVNIEEEVAAFIIAHSPANDRFRFSRGDRPVPVANTSQVAAGKRKLNFIETLRAWFARVTGPGQDIKLLATEEAQHRFNACARCPHNINWRTGCVACNEEIERESLLLRQTAKLSKPPELLRKKAWTEGACRLHAVELLSACFLPSSRLSVERAPSAPDACWLGRDGL